MAPEPRIGFEMTLLRMLAFRPESPTAQVGQSPTAAPDTRAARALPAAPTSAAKPALTAVATTPVSAVTTQPAAAPALTAPAPAATPLSLASIPAAGGDSVRPLTIDAGNWAAVVEAAKLTGMVRQFALNCVPAGFDNRLLRLQFDQAVADRRTPQIDEKLLQGLSQYFGAEIRIAFESLDSALITPARRRTLAEEDKILRAAAAFEEDPAVKGLRERFGAEIDAASVKPIN
jgi:DNA polymerase-3 subunit gamma/tau